jgi:hypothetical protein
MNLTPILVRSSKILVVTLPFLTGIVFAHNPPVVSPPLGMRPGTILTVRINQPLSSDHNQVGDGFSATLTQPVIVLGIVVSRYGQTATGRIVEAKKAGRVSGVSRLGITLTRLTLVDGQTVPIESQLLVREGPTSVGRDAAGMAGATGVGAAIGAAADGGSGAAIGAGIGAAAGTIGVLLTRGYPTIIEPETLLTFQVTVPVTIETNNAPQAFRFASSADYPPPAQTRPQQAPAYLAPPPYPYYLYYAPSYYPYYRPYWGYPYFYGPSFSFFFGYPFGYPAYYHYRGYYGYRGHYGYLYPRPVPYRGGIIAYTAYGRAHH